jgi:hypothetical protein
MQLMFTLFPIAVVFIVGVATLIFVLNKRKREMLSSYALERGYSYTPRQSGMVEELFAPLQANRVVAFSEGRSKDSFFSDVITGTFDNRPFRYYCYTRTEMKTSTRGASRQTSLGMGIIQDFDIESATRYCLQIFLRKRENLPDLWLKKHSPLDGIYRLTGLTKVELNDPEMMKRYRLFCLDQRSVSPLVSPALLGWLEKLGSSELIQIHGNYTFLTDHLLRSPQRIEERLVELSSLCALLEE